MPLEHVLLGVAVVLLVLMIAGAREIRLLMAANLEMAKQNSALLGQVAELHALIAENKNPESQGGDGA